MGIMDGDYILGRMTKLPIKYSDIEITFNRGATPHIDYQGWVSTYPTNDALMQAAISSLSLIKGA